MQCIPALQENIFYSVILGFYYSGKIMLRSNQVPLHVTRVLGLGFWVKGLVFVSCG